MADGRHIAKCWKRYNLPIYGPIWMKLGWSHPTMSHMSAMMRLPWQRPLPSNGALNILQLWASGGRTREQILMKFGTQQQVRIAITVMRSNIKIFKIQNGGRPPCWKYIRNTITRLPINRLGRNLGGHISSCPRHVLHDAVAMAT